MNKFLLLGLGCALAAPATAQTAKGTRYLGASVSNLGYSRHQQSSFLSLSLTPVVGTFVADNFLLGAGLELSYWREHNDVPNQKIWRQTASYAIRPLARYYLPGAGSHRFYGQVGAQWYRYHYATKQRSIILHTDGQQELYQEDQRSSSSSFGLVAAVGYNYFLTPAAALQVEASYYRFRPFSAGSSGSFGLSAGFAVFLPSGSAAAQ